jgi:cellulose synthase/poly-beta-1,6-N-acetylglucosamine synthase-like glycosyltransferase
LSDGRKPPGSLLVAVLGGLCGALLGALAFLMLWGFADPDAGFEGAQQILLESGFVAAPAGWFVVPAAVAGFLLVGSLVRNRLVASLFAGAARGAVVGAGAAAGALFGTVAYVGFWVANNPSHSLDAALTHAVGSFGDARDPYTLFLLAGTLAGTVGALYVAGKGLVRSAAKLMAGALVGGLAGLVIYSFAYVTVFYPGLPHGPEWVLHFAEAVYSFTPSELLLVGLAALAGAFLSRYSWRLYGVLTFVSLLFVVLGYAIYTVADTLPNVPPAHRPLSYLLFVCELASLGMVVLYSFYTIDVAARKHWRRTTDAVVFSPYYMPKVALQVPTYNEPFELVRDTLRSLLALDYPRDRMVIMVADDSTRAESSEPLRRFCEENGILYHHRAERGGYKAGALNALLAITPRDVNLIAVIDADYQVEPEYLKETVGYFIDADLGWLQTPQDYRNRHESFLTEQYYLADAYFYRTILPSRNEENSIIFCGTMGILRKRALVEVGGWNEKCITEDAELAVRLLNAGWRSLYVNKTYGRGLIPPTFEAYKKQHYRWAFGGGKILRAHWWRFLFGRFTFRQRLDYLIGTLNWLEGSFIFAIAVFVLYLGLADIAGSSVITHHANEILLVGLVPLFLLLDGLTRVHLVLRRAVNLGFGGTLRILGMWFSVKFSNMQAAWKAVLGFSIPFVRTPKAPSERIGRMAAVRLAVRITRLESTMAAFLILTSLGVLTRLLLPGSDAGGLVMTRMFLLFWLVYYATVFLAAPLYAYKSFSTLRPVPGTRAPEVTSKEATA